MVEDLCQFLYIEEHSYTQSELNQTEYVSNKSMDL